MEQVIEDLGYYYACRNEPLPLEDGRTFYPLLPEDQEAFDASPYASHAVANPARHLLAVADPGPGDDVGTLTIYSDGMAHWRSDSGIAAWMTQEQIEYDWIC